MTRRHDVAIVGGGVVGAALAFGLVASGARIAVFDEGDPAAPSRNNFGLVWLQGKGAGCAAYASWTLESVRAWPAFADALAKASGIDVGLAQDGGLHVCATRAAVEARRRSLDALFAQPAMPTYAVDWIDAPRLREAWPWRGGDAAGATFCALDGHCDFRALASALRSACTAGGAEWVPRRVDGIDAASRGFRLSVHGTTFDSDRVVIAAGLRSRPLGAMVGIDVPLRPVKGHVLALESTTRMTHPAETLRSTRDGQVLAGDSHEERSEPALDAAVLAAIAQRTLRIAPALADAKVADAWAALRVMSPDGRPVYAQSSRHRGAFVVVAHSGVTLAAAHATTLGPALLGAELPVRLRGFGCERFAGEAPAFVRGTRAVAPLPRPLAGSTLADVARWPTTDDAVRSVTRDGS